VIKQTLSHLLLALTLFTTCHIANALTTPPGSRPKSFLGPILQLSREDTLTENTGFNLLGEAGPKNFRAGGTFGWASTAHQRFKLSAEYLWQNITYAFFSGDTTQWMSQGALGLAYEADVPQDQRFQTQFNVSGFLSHAGSKNLSSQTGTYLYNNAVSNYIDLRRIAGSNAGGISPGVTVQPWEGGTLKLNANYDNVRYDTIYTQNQDAKGLGGTIALDQALIHNLDIHALASVRAPFNQYEGDLGWTTDTSLGEWRFGLGSTYIIGKNTLPSTYTVTLAANYLPNQPQPHSTRAKIAAWRLLDWLAKPAIYLPQVLAIADERVTNCDNPPVLFNIIGDNIPPGSEVGFEGAFSQNLVDHFQGDNLIYSINYNGQPNNGSVIITNGELIGNNNYPSGRYTNISVTARNDCGSVTSNLFTAVHV
jgi:hypothetical protein